MAANRELERRHLPDTESPEFAPFWQGCRRGELRIPKCKHCGKLVWYPRITCPECHGEEIDWAKVSGRGRLFTWVTVHRAFLPGFEKRVPYTTALVELIEDPAVRLTTILDRLPDGGLRIGLAVEVVFERVDERLTLPRFRVVTDEPRASVG